MDSRGLSAPVSQVVRIENKRGLHARASAKFVTLASALGTPVEVAKDGNRVCGTSIMGLMMLAASPGTSIRVEAVGAERCELAFARPQWAVTPGQSAVLYDGDVCLGGGVITTSPEKGADARELGAHDVLLSTDAAAMAAAVIPGRSPERFGFLLLPRFSALPFTSAMAKNSSG